MNTNNDLIMVKFQDLTFGTKDVIYIGSLIMGLCFQYYSLKSDIHDAIMEVSYQKSSTIQQFAMYSNNMGDMSKRLLVIERLVGDKPKEIKLETE